MIEEWKRAYNFARFRDNTPEDSEDFASWVIEKKLTGRKAGLKYLWIDWIRRKYSFDKNKAFNCDYMEEFPTPSNQEELVNRKLLFTEITKNDRSNQILMLYCIYNNTMKEVGEVFDITESRVCQIFKEIEKEIRNNTTEMKGLCEEAQIHQEVVVVS